jgi:hypothetical protein
LLRRCFGHRLPLRDLLRSSVLDSRKSDRWRLAFCPGPGRRRCDASVLDRRARRSWVGPRVSGEYRQAQGGDHGGSDGSYIRSEISAHLEDKTRLVVDTSARVPYHATPRPTFRAGRGGRWRPYYVCAAEYRGQIYLKRIPRPTKSRPAPPRRRCLRRLGYKPTTPRQTAVPTPR